MATVCLFGLASAVLWAPAALADALIEGGLSLAGAGFIAGSAALHIGYYAALQRAYAHGDLSVVYPLARGTGPILSVAAAIVLIGERPSALALAGGALIVAAVLALAVGSTAGMAAAILTGAWTAAYTVWDAHAVNALDQPPVFYAWAYALLLALALTPFAAGAAEIWRAHRRTVLTVGALNPLAYVLVLFALTRAPISLVAPVRECSVVIGALLGARVLKEGHLTRRILAATAIALGIAALAIA
jgi:drug/metabolite transporter (DMT)-like permease